MIDLSILDFMFHLDKYVGSLIQQYGVLIYAILFLIIFIETGLVIVPFLPGDSLLFVVGTFAALGMLNLAWLLVILIFAAVLGDTLNYWIGYYVDVDIFEKGYLKFLKRRYLDRTHQLYEKYGSEIIILARFIPFARTFAPFVAGIAKMKYRKFISYNVIGGAAWVLIITLIGYFFGNLPIVKQNFGTLLLIIIIGSVAIAFLEFFRHSKDEVK